MKEGKTALDLCSTRAAMRPGSPLASSIPHRPQNVRCGTQPGVHMMDFSLGLSI